MKYVKVIDGFIDVIYDSEMDGTVEAPDYITLEHKLVDGEWFLPPPPPPEPEPVPQSVTMAQARIALRGTQTANGNNLLIDTQAYIDSIADADERETTLIAWNLSPNVSRTGALVTGIGTSLGLTATQLDNLFIAAAAIEL